MSEEIKAQISAAVKKLFDLDIKAELDRPDQKFGDYSTNVAMHLAGQLGESPRAIAEQLVPALASVANIAKAEIAGPGFINITLEDKVLWQLAKDKPAKSLAGKVVVAEYSDPNPFKVLHAGHLYTSVVGDAIANLLENAGAKVHRVNFGGDVGLHVAKTMWAIIQSLGGENPQNLDKVAEGGRTKWLSERYIEGNEAYENDEKAQARIVELNKLIYAVHASDDHDSPLAKIYWTTRSWSYEYFDEFYARIGTKFEKYYPESVTAPIGLEVVKRELKNGVYEESDGAVVFKAEKYGLHTRVFINNQGLPTYEAKDVGLIIAKWQDYHFDKSVVITGNDIEQYMQVVLKSVEQFKPELVRATSHLTHGQVKLPGGVKMSSRLGNIIPAVAILDLAAAASRELSGSDNEATTLGAVKYAFLKQRLGADIIYDPAESVSLAGNSGPYLQYAYARACSIIAKAGGTPKNSANELDPAERGLLRKVGEYNEVLDKATAELLPHHICSYLYELAQTFNSFYEKSRIVGDPRQETRLELVRLYAQTLSAGLKLLGVEAPERI